MRQILNKDEAKVEQAKALLEKDDSPANWKKVAAKYSTDTATKDSGGLRSGVAKGQSDPALEGQIFSAPQGQLVGPFKAQAGFYLIEVEKITPASDDAAVQGQRADQAAARSGKAAGDRPGLPAGLPRQVEGADLLRRRLRDRPLRQLHRHPPVDPGRSSRDLDTRRLAGARDRVPRAAGPGSAAGADSAAVGRRTARRDRPGGGQLPPGGAPPARAAPAPAPGG